MRIDLCQSDYAKFENLTKIREMNLRVLEIYSRFLREHSCFIKKELVQEITRDCQVSEEYAYSVLLAAACGLDIVDNNRDRQIARSYLLSSIKKLNPTTYRENPYYKNIRVPESSFRNWELKYQSYMPYEAFIFNDIVLNKAFLEIPQLGFFDETFVFPAVLESGNEWMSITPNEIETMRPALQCAHGRVITFGLGLGYFAYMASCKAQVQSVTIVEKDNAVSDLFRDHILPQFPQKDKVQLISSNAFDFAKDHMAVGNFDSAFVDLWHDVSDGVDMYLKMKQFEDLSPKTMWSYWIEQSLLSNLRWYVFETLVDGTKTNDSPIEQEKNAARIDNAKSCPQEYSRKLEAVAAYFEGMTIRSFDEISHYLSDEALKTIFSVHHYLPE